MAGMTMLAGAKHDHYELGTEQYNGTIFDPVTVWFYKQQVQHPYMSLHDWVRSGMAGAYIKTGSKFNPIEVVIDTGDALAGPGRFEIEIVNDWYDRLASDVANFIAEKRGLEAPPFIELYYGGDELKKLKLEQVRELGPEDIRVIVDSSKGPRIDPRRKTEIQRESIVELTDRELKSLQALLASEIARILRSRLIGANQQDALSKLQDANFLQPIVSCAIRNPIVHGTSEPNAYLDFAQKYDVKDIGGLINDVVQRVMACACSLKHYRKKKKDGKKTTKQTTTVAISSSMRDMLEGRDERGEKFQQDLIECGILGTLHNCWDRVLHCKKTNCTPSCLPKQAYRGKCGSSSSSSSSDCKSSSSSDESCSSDSGVSSGEDRGHAKRHARKLRRYHSGRYSHHTSDEDSCSSSSSSSDEEVHERGRQFGVRKAATYSTASSWRVYQPSAYSRVGDEVSQESARIQVTHLIPDAPAVDIYIGAEGAKKVRAVDGLSYGQALEYIPIGAGTYDVDVRVGDQTILSLSSLELGAGKDYTIAAIGAANAGEGTLEGRGATLVALEDKNDDEKMNVRVIHASPNAGAVDIYVNDVFAFGPVSYVGEVLPSYVAVPIGTQKVSVKAAGTDDTVLEETLELEEGKIYTVVAYGFAGNAEKPLAAKVIVSDAVQANEEEEEQNDSEDDSDEEALEEKETKKKKKKKVRKSVTCFKVRVIGDDASSVAADDGEDDDDDDFDILGENDEDDLFDNEEDLYAVPVSRSIMSEEDNDTMPALLPIKPTARQPPRLIPIGDALVGQKQKSKSSPARRMPGLTSISDALCCDTGSSSSSKDKYKETCKCCSNFLQLLETSGVGEQIEDAGRNVVVFSPTNAALSDNVMRGIQSQSKDVQQKFVHNYIHEGSYKAGATHKTIGSRLFNVSRSNVLLGTANKEYALHEDKIVRDPSFKHVQYVPHEALHRQMKSSM